MHENKQNPTLNRGRIVKKKKTVRNFLKNAKMNSLSFVICLNIEIYF